jgi:hypothetical protein
VVEHALRIANMLLLRQTSFQFVKMAIEHRRALSPALNGWLEGPEMDLRDAFRPDGRPAFHNRTHNSRIRLDVNAIIDGRSSPLLAARVTFGRLHHVPQEKWELL